MLRSVVFILLILISTQVNAKTIKLNSDINCLIANIYKEARGESTEGKIEVGIVTLNRVKDTRWPNTVCGVVKQKSQFSWYKNQKTIKINSTIYNDLHKMAKVILDTSTNTGVYYYINPHEAKYTNWLNNLDFSHRIGLHDFYVDKN